MSVLSDTKGLCGIADFLHRVMVVHTEDDDDDFDLFLQKQQPAQRYIPIGYVPPGIKGSTCDDATIMSLMVLS